MDRKSTVGKGKERRWVGQPGLGAKNTMTRNRLADWPSRAQAGAPMPSGEIEMQRIVTRHWRRERQMATSSRKTRFQSRPLKWMLAS